VPFGAGGGQGGCSTAITVRIGGLLLGKASQRHKDEEAAGQFQREAHDALAQLKAGIANDSIDGSQARTIFETQILAKFIAQINTLQTKSVRESRLTNQVRDIRAVFDAIITPEIAAQEARKQAAIVKQQTAQQMAQQNALIFSRQIPEFATGGIVPGVNRGFDSVRALLTPGEIVLNRQQQSAIQSLAGPRIFQAAGVPGVNQSGRFAEGGIVSSFGQGGQTIVINELHMDAVVDAEGISIRGMSGENGRRVIIKQVRNSQINRE
jgi:hypothetical protein